MPTIYPGPMKERVREVHPFYIDIAKQHDVYDQLCDHCERFGWDTAEAYLVGALSGKLEGLKSRLNAVVAVKDAKIRRLEDELA